MQLDSCTILFIGLFTRVNLILSDDVSKPTLVPSGPRRLTPANSPKKQTLHSEYGESFKSWTWNSITAFTSARHLSLHWTTLIQSTHNIKITTKIWNTFQMNFVFRIYYRQHVIIAQPWPSSYICCENGTHRTVNLVHKCNATCVSYMRKTTLSGRLVLYTHTHTHTWWHTVHWSESCRCQKFMYWCPVKPDILHEVWNRLRLDCTLLRRTYILFDAGVYKPGRHSVLRKYFFLFSSGLLIFVGRQYGTCFVSPFWLTGCCCSS